VAKILNKVIPVFIGGTGRSGTTITLELLGQHSNFYASNPLEVRIVTEDDGLLDSFENNSIEKFNNKAENFWLNRTKQSEGLYHSINKKDVDKILKEFNENFYKDSKDAVRNFYINIFKKQNTFDNTKHYLGESTPSNIKCADKINKIFPEAKFIHMVRDGRDAAYSIYLMREYWDLPGNKTEFDALDWWYERTVKSFSSLSNLNSDQYISIRFEDLVFNKRQESFLNILNFLNLKEEDAIKKYFNYNVLMEKTNTKSWKNLHTYKDFDHKYNKMLLKLKEQDIHIEKYY
jgi:hypothetical protein